MTFFDNIFKRRVREDVVLDDVRAERRSQEFHREQGKFKYTCADLGIDDLERLAVLTEEVGEVARAVLEHMELVNDLGDTDLRKELVQVAAVAVAWIEALDKE